MDWSLKFAPQMSETQYLQWQQLVEERAGIWFGPQGSILESGVIRRMRALDIESFDDYYQQVASGSEAMLEWRELLNTLTVQETSFFRDTAVFDCLRGFIQQKMTSSSAIQSLDMWSAGCSTGEEAYSMAMVARESAETFGRQIYYGITGTDLSSAALTTASQGIYSERALERMDVNRQRCHFEQQVGGYRVVPELRERVCFIRSNLLEINELPKIQMDVIVCLNVLLYFRNERRAEILHNLVDRLKVGGMLIFGQNEMMGWRNAKVQRLPSRNINAYIRR
ncbi:MAG: type IV pilus assembly protein PilK [Pseudomonadales bacterium]|jgi:type IV pilus assembly protein PilK